TFPRVHILQLTGDVDKDAHYMQQWGAPDAFLDFSPSSIAVPTHIQSAMLAMKHRGRLCLMGAPRGNVEIPYMPIMSKSLEFCFNFMFTRADQQHVVRMAESGLLALGTKAQNKVTIFSIDQWQNAF